MEYNASAVVIGEVIGSSSYVTGRDCTLIFTRHTVSVKTGMKGLSAGTTVTVVQTGGVFGPSKQEVTDDPLMNVGDRAVLFLHLDPEGNVYGVLGGPQGRLQVENGLVYSLNALYPDRNIDLAWTIAGISESSFIAQL